VKCIATGSCQPAPLSLLMGNMCLMSVSATHGILITHMHMLYWTMVICLSYITYKGKSHLELKKDKCLPSISLNNQFSYNQKTISVQY
jgi:hypothetical protein